MYNTIIIMYAVHVDAYYVHECMVCTSLIFMAIIFSRENLPSADQLQLMYGKLQSKVSAVDAMIAALESSETTTTVAQIVQNLKDLYGDSEEIVTSNVTALMASQIQCLKTPNTNTLCDAYDDRRRDTIEALAQQAEDFSTYQYGTYFKSPQKFLAHLQREKASLEAEIEKVSSLLDLSSPYLGGFLDDSKLAVANLSLATRDRQWLQFDYDSSSFFNDENRVKTSKSVSASFSGGFWFFRARGSYSSTKNTDDYNQKLAKSKLRVRGEMLRVNIKRPWFKPELFEVRDITYVSTLVASININSACMHAAKASIKISYIVIIVVIVAIDLHMVHRAQY